MLIVYYREQSVFKTRNLASNAVFYSENYNLTKFFFKL